MKAVVAQNIAREHYLAARALARSGMLSALVTNWYAPHSGIARFVLGRLGRLGKRMLAAGSSDLAGNTIIASHWRTLGLRLMEACCYPRSENPYVKYLRSDSLFARHVARAKLPHHDVFFTYSYAALEALMAEQGRGMFTVLDQIDPGPVHFDKLAEEENAWPGYVNRKTKVTKEYITRNKREWEVAHLIVVNSEWSRKALIEAGCCPEKIEVLPLAYEFVEKPVSRARKETNKINVLWAGRVNVNKGIQYLIEVAKVLASDPVRFIIVGPINIPQAAIDRAPNNIDWIGPVPRSEVSHYYAKADVFVLPTISDGFALTQLEAMAHGLPVIATPNCGRVVEDGRNGFVVPARNVNALAKAIMNFVKEPSLLSRMTPTCLARAKDFSIDNYGKRLIEIIESRMRQN